MPLSRKSWNCWSVLYAAQRLWLLWCSWSWATTQLASVDSGKVDCTMSRSVSAVLDILVAQLPSVPPQLTPSAYWLGRLQSNAFELYYCLLVGQQLFPCYAHYAEAVSSAERQNCNLLRSLEMESKQSVAVAYVHKENATACFSLHFAAKCRHYVKRPILDNYKMWCGIVNCKVVICFAEFFSVII